MLPAMSKALGAKLSPGDAPQDLLAGLWGLAQLGAKADAGMLSKAAGVIKAAVGELSTEQQVYAAWSFALLGQVGVVGGLLAGQQAVAAAMLCRRCYHTGCGLQAPQSHASHQAVVVAKQRAMPLCQQLLPKRRVPMAYSLQVFSTCLPAS